MIDKVKLRQLAMQAGKLIRGNPELYKMAKRGYDRLTGGPFIQLKNIIKSTPPELLEYPDKAASKGDILFFSPRWWVIHLGWEVMIAHILRNQGYRPHFIICDHAVDVCDTYNFSDEIGWICPQCKRDIRDFLKISGIEFSTFSDWIDVNASLRNAEKLVSTGKTISELKNLTMDGFPLGEWSRLSIIRHLKRVNIPEHDDFCRDRYSAFLKTACLTLDLAKSIFEKEWAGVFLCNGKFFQERIIHGYGREKGVDVFVYERGLKEDHILLARNEFVIDFDVSAIYERRSPLSPEEEKETNSYMNDRIYGKNFAIDYWPEVLEEKREVIEQLRMDENKPMVVAFPNITWDTAVLDREIVFESMWDWLDQTVRYFLEKGDTQLIVRIHPAEVRLPFKFHERVGDLIRKTFPDLPGHIRIVESDSPISSYTLLAMAKKVLVYTSSLGLESAFAGREVIVTAKTHYRGKGFTRDPETPEEYFRFLEDDVGINEEEVMSRAARYARALYFDAHIPIQCVKEEDYGNFHYTIGSLEELLNGDFGETAFFSRFPFPGEKGMIPRNFPGNP